MRWKFPEEVVKSEDEMLSIIQNQKCFINDLQETIVQEEIDRYQVPKKRFLYTNIEG